MTTESPAPDDQDPAEVPAEDRPMTAPTGPARIRPEDEDGDVVPDDA